MTRSNLTRRRLLCESLAFAAAGVPLAASTQPSWPTRPVRILTGTPPGDSTDASARQIAQRLSKALGQPVYVENKPGAHGFIVAEAVKNAPKDGYTLLMSSGGQMAINPSLYKKMPYDPVKDFVPVTQINNGFLYLAVNNALPVKDVKEFIAYVKAHPGQLSYGSGGSGTTQHLTMEMLKKRADLDIAHIPYRGSPLVVQDLIGGQIACAFDAGASILPHARQGKVRLLGITSPTRLASTADLATFQEQGLPGFEARVWSGLFAPTGTPPPVVAKLNAAMNQMLREPEFIAFVRSNGGEPAGGGSEDFGRFLGSEIAKWTPVVRDSGAQVD
jgi:tripartite-type tricarboxylate transporter receptor subunit TctC